MMDCSSKKSKGSLGIFVGNVEGKVKGGEGVGGLRRVRRGSKLGNQARRDLNQCYLQAVGDNSRWERLRKGNAGMEKGKGSCSEQDQVEDEVEVEITGKLR